MSVFGYILSFLRDRAFAHYFGASELFDVYVASFRIPDVLFIVATAFISVYALLPMFEEKMRQGDNRLKEFVNTSFYFLVLFLVLGSTILFFAIPSLGEWLFDDFSSEGLETFVLFSRIYLIQASLFAISSFFTAILQLKRKFFLYSLLALLYNIGIIIGVVVLYPMFGPIGLALGVLLGVIINVGIQVPVLLQNNILPQLAPTRHTVRECWRTIKISIPRASALLSHTITQILVFSVVVGISEGALSIYYFAESLKAVPTVLIGTAYSVAAFPILVTHFTEGNMEAFRSVIESALRRLFFFILPIIAFVFILREPLISLIFETGSFTAEITAITAAIVGVFIVGALTMSILIICARALYACGRSLAVFLIFLTLSAVEIVLIYTIIPFIQNNSEATAMIQQVTGLESAAYGTLFVATLIIVIPEIFAATTILIVLLRHIRQDIKPLLQAFAQNLIAVMVLAIATAVPNIFLFGNMQFNSINGIFAIGGMSIIGMSAWFVTLRLLKNPESKIVQKKAVSVINRIWRT
ncbi:MAG: hypothetical protein OXB96_01400 [Candidatus Kaiserbacteria bacterium]|nr:hypothetical protein [Candidatus Kaiserbacteria bacterium]